MKRFPDGFYFGASTSSHQVEGGCSNDWTEWEKRNAERLAGESVRYKDLPSWKEIEKQALDPDNYISGKAIDHYNRYKEDFTLAKKIGINACRFSIEWARVEPERGEFSKKEFDHYKKMIEAMLNLGIEPFITVWHWTLPLWLSKEGGVKHPDFPELFSRYAAKLAEEFSGKAGFFILINEPEIYSLNGYLRGVWPPEEKGIRNYRTVMKILIKSHNEAYKEIKKVAPEASVGTACNMFYFEAGGSPVDKFTAFLSDLLWNRYFTERVKRSMDFAGLNYYFHNRIHYGFNKNERNSVSDMGWELYPQGILPVLLGLKKYNVPVYITENGLADAADSKRAWFIEETLRSVLSAITIGVDVRGYFHWSLLDNFEWDKGFWPRFGLISVDYKNLSRKVRSSADTYKQIITEGIEL